MDKLTKDEITKVFAMYWGCRIDAGLITVVDSYWIDKVAHDQTDTVLKLTPLSNISDEDAIEVAKMLIEGEIAGLERYLDCTNPYISDEVKLKYFKKTVQVTFRRKNKYNRHVYCLIYLDGSGFSVNDNKKFYNVFPVYQYLIYKGYAVPLFFAPNHWANGKNAIELGIAIEKD